MHAEEALRRSQQQLQQMIDAVPVRIWSVTSMDGPVYFNERYQDHFRAVIADFDAIEEPRIETLLQELIYPEDAPEVQRTLLNCFEFGSGAVIRFRWLEKDGTYRWAECRVEPRRDQDGTIVQWYGVSLDVDDEVRAQEALRQKRCPADTNISVGSNGKFVTDRPPRAKIEMAAKLASRRLAECRLPLSL